MGIIDIIKPLFVVLNSAVYKSQKHQNSTPRIETGAAGWEASMQLPLCNATPKSFLSGKKGKKASRPLQWWPSPSADWWTTRWWTRRLPFSLNIFAQMWQTNRKSLWTRRRCDVKSSQLLKLTSHSRHGNLSTVRLRCRWSSPAGLWFECIRTLWTCWWFKEDIQLCCRGAVAQSGERHSKGRGCYSCDDTWVWTPVAAWGDRK